MLKGSLRVLKCISCKHHKCTGRPPGWLLGQGLPGLAGPPLLIKLASFWKIGLFS